MKDQTLVSKTARRKQVFLDSFLWGQYSEENTMLIGDRLRARTGRQISQEDIEKRTGLLRCYISRVENGHTVPALETLEKFALALDVPPCRLFYQANDGLTNR